MKAFFRIRFSLTNQAPDRQSTSSANDNLWDIVDEAQKAIVKKYPGKDSVAQELAINELKSIASSNKTDEEIINIIRLRFLGSSEQIKSERQESSVSSQSDNLKETRMSQQEKYQPENASAQYQLGLRYDNGDGVQKDSAEAVKWFRKAAEQGYAPAQNEYGKHLMNERDVVEAVMWFRKAADQGYDKAQNNLGICYATGQGVKKDMVEAVKWYRKAKSSVQTCYLLS